MSTPFLSIAIPTYKRPHRLRRLLETLAQQTGVRADEWEIVVSDNCSLDDTPQVIAAFSNRLPNLRYIQNPKNIGADMNMRSLFDKAWGEYVWIMPDDDFVNGDHAIASMISKLQKCPIPPNFLITNAKIIHTDTGELLKPTFNPITGDIFLSDGKDILNVINDFDLVGWQRLVLRRNALPDDFADKYSLRPVVGIAMGLAACAKGSALIVGEPLSVFCDADPTDWRVYWASICMQEMPELLWTAVKELGYSAECVSRLIEQRKNKYFSRIVHANVLLFQIYGISWQRLARLYGWGYVVKQILLKAPLAIPFAMIWPWRRQLMAWIRRFQKGLAKNKQAEGH